MTAETLHATAVALQGRGLLILGRAGSGKSSLALDLIALGADLVADDLVLLTRTDGKLTASAPARRGLIEARGIGVLSLPSAASAPVFAAIDLDRTETERLPPLRRRAFLGVETRLLLRPDPLLPAALIAYLAAGGALDPGAAVQPD